MATVNKNFRIKHGLIVEGTTGTINGQAILTETGSDNYILNLIGGETLVKSVESTQLEVDGAGKLSVKSNVFDAYGSASTAESNANDYTDGEITTALTTAQGYATAAQGNAEDYADSLASNYDAAGSAATAQSNAEDYADSLASNYDAAGAATGAYNNAVADANEYTDGEITTALTTAAGYATTAENNAKSYADGLASNYDPAGSATTAQNNAEDYTDSAISALNLSGTYDALGAASTALQDAKDYTDQEVAALVDSAPALLDTLNELAAAIADNPNYATDVATAISGKQNTLTASTGITIDGSSNISVTANTYDAYGAASTAQSNAEDYADTAADAAELAAKNYADGLAGNYDSAGAAATAESNANDYTDTAIANGDSTATPAYSALTLGGYTKQVGAWVAAGTASTQVTAFAYSTNWGSSEFLVRVMSSATGHQHSQLSKVLVTTDAAGNVAVTEYGIVTTNGSMGDVTADISGGNVRILVTPTYDSSEVIVSGTLLAYND